MDFSESMQIYCSSETGILYTRKQYKSCSSLQCTAMQIQELLETEENKSLTPNLTHRAMSSVNSNTLILVIELFSGTEAKWHKMACLRNVKLF